MLYTNDIDTATEIQVVSNTPNMFSMYERFIRYIDVSEATANTYSRSLKQFFKYLAEYQITAPKRDDVLSYKQALIEKKLAPSTIQTYLIAVRRFFKWAHQEDLYQNIADDVKGVKIHKTHRKDYLTSAQIKQVFNTLPKETVIDKRNYAIVALMVTSGLRTIEVSRADIGDMKTLGNSTVLYIHGKGRTEKDEYVKLSDAVEIIIRNYLLERPKATDKSPLFTSTSNNNKNDRLTTRSISGIVKDALRNAGYNSDRLTAHSLRHSAGTLNLLNGGTLEETQQLLRHSNINTTMIYLHHLEREDNKSEQRISDAIFK